MKYIFFLIGFLVYQIYFSGNKRKKFYKKAYKVWLNNIKKLNLNIKKKINKKIYKSIFDLCFNKINIPVVNFDKISLFTNNKKLINSLVFDINSSFKSIYIIFYIWEPGFLSNKVALSLIKASYRGVKCKIILDSIGSLNFFKTIWPNLMIKSGIEILESFKFNILNLFFIRVDLRQHKKIILIDNYITYIGSMNLIDPYIFKKNIGIGKWMDIMFKINGFYLMKIMKIVFFYDWEIETGIDIFEDYKSYNFINKNNKFYINKFKPNSLVQVITSGPGLPGDLIHRSLLDIIFSSKKRLIITTPYFIPSNFLLDAICTVADKGIDVRIIIPNENDSFLVYWASRYFLNKLLLSNVKIYFFKNNFLHTKTILVDNNLSLIGTVNFDMRSIWLNFEIALIIKDNILNKKLFDLQEKYISQSDLISYDIWKNRPFYNKIFEKLTYLLNPLL